MSALEKHKYMTEQNEGVFRGLLPILLNMANEGETPPSLFIFEKHGSDQAKVLDFDSICPDPQFAPVVVHFAVALLPEISSVTFFCAALALRKDAFPHDNFDEVLNEVKSKYGDIENHPKTEKMYNLFRDNGDCALMSFCKAEALSPSTELQHMDKTVTPDESPVGPFGSLMHYGLVLRNTLAQHAAPSTFKNLSISERIALLRSFLQKQAQTPPPVSISEAFSEDLIIDWATTLAANLCHHETSPNYQASHLH